MKNWLLLITFLIYQITVAQKSKTVINSIAKANGVESWKNVAQIKFTFNVDWKEKNTTKRQWTWNPKTNDISLVEKGKETLYNQSKLDSLSLGADKHFINDKFWLLFPYQLVWDKGTIITLKNKQISPIKEENLNLLTIVYDTEKGYTPGDAYDVFYDDNFIIKEWVFRKGNQEKASLVTTFENYESFNGINIGKEHVNKNGFFRLYFTDVEVIK